MISEAFFSLVDAYMHSKYGDKKTQLYADLPKTVVEIGAGYGANFRYMEKGTHVIAIEPEINLHGILERRAEKYGMGVEIHAVGGEDIPLPDNSVECVICSLVLCSVDDPSMVLSEIKRVLKPEGKFVYVEHVKAEEHSWICRVQQWVQTPWKKVFGGCHVNRDTSGSLQAASFSRIDEKSFAQRTIFIPVIPHIYGIAVK